MRLLFALFLLFNSVRLTAQKLAPPKDQQHILSYFEGGVPNNSEAAAQKLTPGLIPNKIYTGKGQSINTQKLNESRNAVWQLWKQANQSSLLELPTPVLSNGATDQNFETHFWRIPQEDPMPFVLIQKGNRPEKGFPFFLNTHGSGPKAGEWKALKSLSVQYKDAPSIYFVPQIPNEKRYRWAIPTMAYTWERLFKVAMLSDLINPNQLYISGISEGGYGSQRVGAFYADYLAGVAPLAGGEPLENAPPLNFRNTAFTFETGSNDKGFGRNTNTLAAKNIFDSLSKVYPGEFPHRIILQEGRGHAIDYTSVTPWLVNYQRNPHPSHVTWVHYPMYDKYRNGFANMAVLEQFNISDTAAFDRAIFDLKMDRTTNTVNLAANILNYKTGAIDKVSKGILRIYLSPELIDLNKPVTLIVNGKVLSKKKLKCDIVHLIESCRQFGDPQRLYPAMVSVDFSKE